MCPPRGEPNRPTGPAAPRARAPGSGHLLGVASVQGQSPPQPRGAARQVRRQRSSAGALAPSGGHVLGQQPSALPSFHSWTQTPRPTRLLRPETGGPGPSAPIRPGPQPEIQDLPGLAHSPLRQVRFLDTRMQQGRNGLRGSGKQEDVGTSGRKEHRHRLSRPSTPAPTAPHPPHPRKYRPRARTHARTHALRSRPRAQLSGRPMPCRPAWENRNKETNQKRHVQESRRIIPGPVSCLRPPRKPPSGPRPPFNLCRHATCPPGRRGSAGAPAEPCPWSPWRPFGPRGERPVYPNASVWEPPRVPCTQPPPAGHRSLETGRPGTFVQAMAVTETLGHPPPPTAQARLQTEPGAHASATPSPLSRCALRCAATGAEPAPRSAGPRTPPDTSPLPDTSHPTHSPMHTPPWNQPPSSL